MGARTVSVPCPRSRPDEACRLVPGVRFCVSHSEASAEPVARLEVRDGQLVWIALTGRWTFVAVTVRAGVIEPVELAGDVLLQVRHGDDGPKPVWRVHGRDGRGYDIDAESLVQAAAVGRESVECRARDGG